MSNRTISDCILPVLILIVVSVSARAVDEVGYLDLSVKDLMQLRIKPDVSYGMVHDLANTEVVAASKRKEAAFESPSAVYVITGDDIKRSGVTSIPEALRMAPGVQVARIDSPF